MAEYSGVERRKFNRLPIFLPVDFLLFDTAESKQLTGVTHAWAKNVSAGGLLLETATLPAKWLNDLIGGRIKVMLEFKIPATNDSIQTFANVVWMTRQREPENNAESLQMGLSFTAINAEDCERINKFVLKNTTKK